MHLADDGSQHPPPPTLLGLEFERGAIAWEMLLLVPFLPLTPRRCVQAKFPK